MKSLLNRNDTIKVIHDYFLNEIRKTASEESEEYGDRIYTDVERVEELLEYNKYISRMILTLPAKDDNGEVSTEEVLDTVSHYFFDTIKSVLKEPDETGRMVYRDMRKVEDCLEQDLNLEAAIEKFAEEEERAE